VLDKNKDIKYELDINCAAIKGIGITEGE